MVDVLNLLISLLSSRKLFKDVLVLYVATWQNQIIVEMCLLIGLYVTHKKKISRERFGGLCVCFSCKPSWCSCHYGSKLSSVSLMFVWSDGRLQCSVMGINSHNFERSLMESLIPVCRSLLRSFHFLFTPLSLQVQCSTEQVLSCASRGFCAMCDGIENIFSIHSESCYGRLMSSFF